VRRSSIFVSSSEASPPLSPTLVTVKVTAFEQGTELAPQGMSYQHIMDILVSLGYGQTQVSMVSFNSTPKCLS
jgi:hypothetical protein